MKNSDDEILLPGLDGSNLLGFLACLGLIHTLDSNVVDDYFLKWVPLGSSYRPVLRSSGELQKSRFLEQLHSQLTKSADNPAILIAKDLKIPKATFRFLAKQSATKFLNGEDTYTANLVAAFACDSISNEEGLIEDTSFRTMSGAGHQHFLEFMNTLIKETTIAQLEEAMFGPWRYRDGSPTMRWDPEDDRRYALRWDEPSKDPVRTVRGANRLAIAALPLFSVVPISGNRISTTGFSGRGSRNTRFTWPLWNGWLQLDSIRSYLSLKELQQDDCTTSLLAPRGICAVFRSQRITLGKYRNFTPSEAL